MIKTFTKVRNKYCNKCNRKLDIYEGTYNEHSHKVNGRIRRYYLCHTCEAKK